MKKLTTNAGIVVEDNQNSITAGKRGPILMQDYKLIEKLSQFNRERVPERVVHAKGSGAYGVLRVTEDISQYTKAKVLQKGEVTKLFIRISTVAGERGAADAERDVRGFAIKFYTKEGNWDLVGNNTPVFFIRDPMKFPDFIHTQKRHPVTNLRCNNAMWDFWSQMPESIHQVTILFSDRGIPATYRHMNGYGSHTYSLINENNQRVWVKFHFKTNQGIKTLTNEEAEQIIAKDRESHQRDLFNSIKNKNFPSWTFYIQVMSEEEAKKVNFNPFDVTKVWPHKDFPLIKVGEIELNENPKNYFQEVEQAAFSPSNVVPGISFSPDRLLQGRLFAYTDAHLYRIGTHYEKLPVNRPIVEVNNYYLDGVMNFEKPKEINAYYEPNSFNGPKEDPSYKEPPFPVDGDGYRYDFREDDSDYFSQPRALFNLMSDYQKEQLFNNIAASMQGVEEFIIQRTLKLFEQISPEYKIGVEKALKG